MQPSLQQVEQVLITHELARASWYDAEHSILLAEIWGRWTWDDAYTIVAAMQSHISQQDHPVFTIFYFLLPEYTLARGGNFLVQLRRLMQHMPKNEALVCFVRLHKAVHTFLATVSKAYALSAIFSKYAFLNSFDEALQAIAAVKAKQTELPPSPENDL